ncbi:hypothetical protein WJ976_12840 [Achromobacter denitrificans]
MSRRYGRNQRRRARERIAELEQQGANLNQALAMDRALMAKMSERNRTLAEIIDLVREELPNHPLLPVDERQKFDLSDMKWELSRGHSARVQVASPLPPFITSEPAVSMDAMCLHTEIVALLAETEFSAMREQVHLRVWLGPEVSAYGISTRALATMDPARLEQTLTREIAPALARSLVAAWQGLGLQRRRG